LPQSYRNSVESLSVIIPVLNEAKQIVHCINSVRKALPESEIVVVDGGSRDETINLAKNENTQVVSSPPGRGIQCRAGADDCNSEILIFIHADCRLGNNTMRALENYFIDEKKKIAVFKIKFLSTKIVFRILEWFTSFDSLFTRFGDQGIIVRRSFYSELGGFPAYKLFEDVDFLRKARRHHSIGQIDANINSSVRRFKRTGFFAQMTWNAVLLFLYCLGVNPDKLYLLYHREHKTPTSP